MARAKSERARSKTLAIDDLTQGIEQLQAFIPKLEDLGREGFPYLEGALARTELQLRECIKRAFGDKSPEFQSHRQLKLSLSSPADKKQTLTLIKGLIGSLEDKKLELQGIKPAVTHNMAVSSTAPELTLVPQSPATAQLLVTPASHPASTTLHLVPGTENSPSQPPATGAAPIPVAPPATLPGAHSIPPRAPIEPISSLFRTQETKPLPSIPEHSPPVRMPAPPQGDAPLSAPPAATPVPMPSAAECVVDTGAGTASAPPTPPLSTAAPVADAEPHVAAGAFSTTQEVRVPSPSAVPSTPSPPPTLPASAAVDPDVDYLALSKSLCQRFHAVARQLRLRGEYRPTISVEDEIDVQDLIHALLRQHFEDIGTDEWTPGYGDGVSRTTFLLNHDRLAIVAKKTRTGLSRKDLTEQVRADAERYRARGRCTQLLCFIYDPEGRIGNPRGLENELASSTEHFTVDVIVAPK